VERFKSTFSGAVRTSISTDITFIAEVKHGSKKTNPNVRVVAGDEHFVYNQGYLIEKGRDFSVQEAGSGKPVAIIGDEIRSKLFGKGKGVGEYILLFGQRYMVAGVFKRTGSGMGGGSADRLIVIPFYNGIQYSGRKSLYFDVKVSVDNPTELPNYLDEGRGVMRMIRGDRPGQPDSFTIERSETLAESLDSISANLRIGGFLIGFITLLGAAIGLVNIMLVSVTERTQEIGVRKAMGATPARIRQQFLMEAIVICVLGGIGGIVLGITIGNIVAKIIGSEQFIVPWLWMILGLAICIFVGIVSGYYPAHKASKLDPIEALRFE
jgi:putative ABC transport system permease protein